MKIGITGATGQLGRLVVEQLKTKVPTTEIVALVRNPAKATGLGVEAREADYSQPDSLTKALEGIDKLLLISSNEIGHRLEQHRNVIQAAKAAGVQQVAYTSVLRADTTPLNLAPEHLATEVELQQSGLEYTILRNGWYFENYTVSIPGALAGGAFLGSAQDGQLSMATRSDFAAAAVAVLTESGHEGQTYELAGDIAYTLTDLAAEISQQTGREIPYKDLPADEYAAILRSLGLPELFAVSLPAWDVDASTGALFDDGHQLSKLIGRPTTTLAEAVAAALPN